MLRGLYARSFHSVGRWVVIWTTRLRSDVDVRAAFLCFTNEIVSMCFRKCAGCIIAHHDHTDNARWRFQFYSFLANPAKMKTKKNRRCGDGFDAQKSLVLFHFHFVPHFVIVNGQRVCFASEFVWFKRYIAAGLGKLKEVYQSFPSHSVWHTIFSYKMHF